jgi:hypothetical protein
VKPTRVAAVRSVIERSPQGISGLDPVMHNPTSAAQRTAMQWYCVYPRDVLEIAETDADPRGTIYLIEINLTPLS